MSKRKITSSDSRNMFPGEDKKKLIWIPIIIGAIVLIAIGVFFLFFYKGGIDNGRTSENPMASEETQAFEGEIAGTWEVQYYVSAGRRTNVDPNTPVTIVLHPDGSVEHITTDFDGSSYQPVIYTGRWEETETGFIESFDDDLGTDVYEYHYYRKNQLACIYEGELVIVIQQTKTSEETEK